MEEKQENIFLIGILTILMIVAIVILILNPNKVKKTDITIQTDNTTISSDNIKNNEEINKKEEKIKSMQEGNLFCKIEEKIVFYEEQNKSIYLFQTNENKIDKLTTLESGVEKLYFDGDYIYTVPNYYKGKGIYKIDLEGNIQKISEDISLQLLIKEDKIFYVRQIGYDTYNNNPQGTICSIDKDGSNLIEIAKNVKNYFYLQDEKIYYTTQDRKMYSIAIDGTGKELLTQGRRFVLGISQKNIVYIDYADNEAIHIINLEDKTDSVIGYSGNVGYYQGKKYLVSKKRLDDGAIEDKYTLYKIKEDGEIQEISKLFNDNSKINYIINEKAYLSNEQEGIYIINLNNEEKEDAEKYKEYRYFLGGYAYKIDDLNLEDIKVDKVEL